MSKPSMRKPPTAIAETQQPQAIPGPMSLRLAARGGIAYFGLAVTATSLTSNFPAPTDGRQEFFRYLADHQGRLQLAALLYALAVPAALLFLPGLFRLLRKAEGATSGLAVSALAGGVLAAASTLTGALVLGTTATRYVDLGPAGARVFLTMVSYTVGATLAGQMLLIGITAAVCLQADVLGHWFAIASVVLALASVIGVGAISYDGAGIQIVANISGSLNAIWILLVSVFLWRRSEPAPS